MTPHIEFLCNSMTDLPDHMRPQAAPKTWEAVFNLFPESGRVLNVGAGRGGISQLLNQAGYQVSSVDLHPEHFSARELECKFADLNLSLPFHEHRFDIVLAVEVIEHLENPWHFIREAIRVLVEDGVLIVTTPNVSSLPSRLAYLTEGLFPYFRDNSFSGCYHATPIFPWTISRCCQTTSAKIELVSYSRIDWPRETDIPRHDGNKGIRRMLLDLLPLNQLTGEISCYRIKKTAQIPSVMVGVHSS